MGVDSTSNYLKERWGYELRVVLDELKAEQQKIGNISGHVLTRKDGQPIKDLNHAFDLALRRAKLLTDKTPKAERITPHSFRRAAITRWTDLGIPRDVMAMSGHKPSGVHDGYIRLTDQMLVDHFRTKGLLLPPSERKTAAGG
jgi:integrase